MKKSGFLSLGFCLFWALFWLLNGIDKFICGKNLGLFVWYGKDRTDQFTGYFDRLHISTSFIQPLLWATGIIEIAAAIPFIWCLAKYGPSRISLDPAGLSAMHKALFTSLILFLGFISFDIVVGDRAELLEHSTYLIVIAVGFIAGYLEFIFLQTQREVQTA